MLRYLAVDISCSEKQTVFCEHSLRETLSSEEQNVQGQISELIFAQSSGYCVYWPSNIFYYKNEMKLSFQISLA